VKLRMERIEFIANLIVTTLAEEKLILVDDRNHAIVLTKQLIIDDLLTEDKLDEEVRQILTQHATQIEKERIPYHQMFRAIKDKLIKERGLIL